MQRNTQLGSGGCEQTLVLEAERKQGRERERERESEDKDFALTPRARKEGGGRICVSLLPRVPKLATTGNIFSLQGPPVVSHTAPSPL